MTGGRRHCFFFSSRRRHTRLQGDWSSDVCSSDLLLTGLALLPSTVTIVMMSTFATRRLLDRLGVKRMLLLGLTAMGLGLLVFSFVTEIGRASCRERV